MAATVQMVFSLPNSCYIRFIGFLLGHMFAFPQVSFFTMERALLYLSARVYTTEHRIHKDMCFSKDAVCGECVSL